MLDAFFDYTRCPREFIDVEIRCALQGGEESGFFRLGKDLLIYGRAAGITAAADLQNPLTDVDPNVEIEASCCMLPFHFDEVIDNLRWEKYVDRVGSRLIRGSNSELLRTIYYFFRPLFPVAVRKHLQRAALIGWRNIRFPAWPVDVTVEKVIEYQWRLLMKIMGVRKIPFIWYWPDGKNACCIMTHDVETKAGRDFCAKISEIESAYGFNSSYQIIPEKRYKADSEFLDEIRDHGCEVNIQGLNHDGHLFRSESEFRRRAVKINRYAKRFGAKGFRSPVLYRQLDWLQDLDFEYDMSVPNIGHLSPQPGGCCTVMPYMLGKLVELPLTTLQDYDLVHILGRHSLDLWMQQSEIILGNHGLLSFNIHPDYTRSRKAIELYRSLLSFLSMLRSEEDLWTPLPVEVSRWWRQRAQMQVVQQDGKWIIKGPASKRARIAYAMLEKGKISYQFDNGQILSRRPVAIPSLQPHQVRSGKGKDNRGIRICVLRHSFYPSDPRVRKEIDALVENGYRVDVICLQKSGQAFREVVDGVRVYRLPFAHVRGSVLRYIIEYGFSCFLMAASLTGLHTFRRYRCIQVNTMPDLLVFSALIPRLTGAKILLDLHEPTPELFVTKFGRDKHRLFLKFQILIEKWAIRFAHRAVTVNKTIRDRFVERGAPKSKIGIVRNVPDENVFQVSKQQDKSPGFMLVTHGSILDHYGHEVAIRVMPLLRDQIEGIHLLIVGSGENEGPLKALSEDLKCSDLITFRGSVPFVEVASIISRAHVGLSLLPATPFAELCQPTKLMEYVALKIPVIASRQAAIEESFDESCVLFYEPENVDDLARRITFIHRHPERGVELAENAFVRYQTLNWSISKRIYLEVVSELTERV